MSTILGVFNKGGDSIERKKFSDLMGELSYWNPDKSSTLIKENIAFGHHMLFTTKNSEQEELPFFQKESNCLITADARLDYREELLKKLGAPKSFLIEKSDSELILKAYLKWGRNCTKFLFGDFAFAIADLEKQEIICARDHFGCRPLYYYNSPEVFVFSSEPKVLLSIPGLNAQIDESFIIDSIMTIPVEKQKSAFPSICRLTPANTLIVNKTHSNEESYWTLEANDKYADFTEKEAKQEFLNCFRGAVKERCRSNYPIGVELSGGLDSSGIAALVCEHLAKSNDKPIAFSHVLDNKLVDHVFPFKDEFSYSRLVAKHLNIDDHCLITGEKGKDCTKLIKEYINQFHRPVGQIFAIMSDQQYRIAQSKHVRIMLSGFGGDHMVSSTASGYFEELAQSQQLHTLKEQIQYKLSNKEGGYYRSLIKLFLIKWMPSVLSLRKFIFRTKDYRYRKMKESVIDRRLIKHSVLKKRLYDKNWFPDENDVRKRQYHRIMQDGISERLEVTNLIAQKYHIEFRYCLLDVKLIELYYSLQSRYKYKEGIGRYIYRSTLNEFLPDEICWRQKEVFFAIPSVYYRVIKDEQSILEIIDDAIQNNKFHYIDCNKLKGLFIRHRSIGSSFIKGFSNRNLLSAISVLLLQKLQREGKIDIGIKC